MSYPSDLADEQWLLKPVFNAALDEGCAEQTPSMVVIDTHLARGASNGGFTFHDRGGPYGRTKGAKRVVAVDVTGLPVGALVVSASTHENRSSELMLEHLNKQCVTGRLELVLVDRGVTAAAARTRGRHHDLELRRVGWDDKQPVFRPIRHAWRVEVQVAALVEAESNGHTSRPICGSSEWPGTTGPPSAAMRAVRTSE